MYHPTLGRFLQRDPIGYPDGLNAYAAYHVMWAGVDRKGTSTDTWSTQQHADWHRNTAERYHRYAEYQRQRYRETGDPQHLRNAEGWDDQAKENEHHADWFEDQLNKDGGEANSCDYTGVDLFIYLIVDSPPAKAEKLAVVGCANVCAQLGATLGEIPFCVLYGQLTLSITTR